MERYLFIILISIFGLIFTSSPVYDIDSSIEYNLAKYGDIANPYYFRWKSENSDDLSFNIKVLKNADIKFSVGVYGFSQYPNDEEVFFGSDLMTLLHDFTESSDSEYDVHKFPFSIIEGVNYLAFYLYIDQVDFVSIYVNSKTQQYPIYDISYKNIYELNNTELRKNEKTFFFKLKIDNLENGIVKLKINKEVYPDKEMEIIMAGFIEEPNTRINNYKFIKELQLDSKYTDEKYSTYEYLYENINNIKYIIIGVNIEKQMNYFSIYIGPKKSDEEGTSPNNNDNNQNQNLNESNNISVPLIILFVVLYTIIILLVFYFILRKCGYSKKDNSSNKIEQDYSLQPEN